MKLLSWIAVLSLALPFLSSAQVLLNQGDVYTFEFTFFEFQAAGTNAPNARVGLGLRDFTGWEGSDTIRFEAFETSTNEAPIFSTNLVASAGSADFFFGPAWQDLQGVFRVTMLQGSASILGFFGSVVPANGDLYSLKVGETNMLAPNLPGLMNLNVMRQPGGGLKLAWSTNLTGYRLQSSAGAPVNSWNWVFQPPEREGEYFTLALNPANAQRFFRLRK